jgi:hypothetical protein
MERYGIGMPYYRSAVSAAYREKRDYWPNRATAKSFEETQQLLTEKYMAYFDERDPTKRASLLKEFNQARRQTLRAIATRRENSSAIMDRLGVGDETAPDASTRERNARSPRAGAAGASGTGRPAAPPLRSRIGSSTSGRGLSSPGPAPELPAGASGARRTPSDVLKRARTLDRENSGDGLPRSGLRSGRDRRGSAPRANTDDTPVE